MKKILLLFFCIFAQLVAKAQSTYYDFTAINDDGETLYYKITDEPWPKMNRMMRTAILPN